MPIGREQENAALWFRYSLPVLEIYNAHTVYYRFPVLEVNIRNIDVETWTVDWGSGDRDTRGIYIYIIYIWEADNSTNFFLCLPKPDWLLLYTLQSNNNQSGFGRQRRKFVLLSASHFTCVFTPITSISGPGFHVDDTERSQIDYCSEAFSSPDTTAIFSHHSRTQRCSVYLTVVTCCYTNRPVHTLCVEENRAVPGLENHHWLFVSRRAAFYNVFYLWCE